MTLIKNLLKAVWPVLMSVAIASCNSDKPFTADVTIEGMGSQNVRVIYFDGNGYKLVDDAVIDSKLTVKGNSPENTLVEIYDNNRRPLGFFVAHNGENLSVKLRRDNPLWLKAEGNKVSERLSAFVKDNEGIIEAGDGADLNAAVSHFIEQFPSEAASGIMLTHYFNTSLDPLTAQSLLNTLSGDALTADGLDVMGQQLAAMLVMNSGDEMPVLKLQDTADTIVSITPSGNRPTIYLFEDKTQVDTSFTNRLTPDSVRVVDIRMRPDTIGWRRNIVRHLPDSTIALHAPYALRDSQMAALGIIYMPFFITTDTAGMQIYRGPDRREAARAAGLNIPEK